MLITCLNPSPTGPGYDGLVFISHASQPVLWSALINTLAILLFLHPPPP